MNPARIPAKHFDPTPTDEEELVAILDKVIYCENETGTVNDESHPLFKTVESVQLDTMETYEQVKSYLFPIA